MAIAYLASSYASNFSVDSSTTSWSYDSLATGSDRCLVVAVTYENNTTPADITAVTYNSVALTHQVTFVDDGGGFDESTEIWTLAAPATGSNTLAFTISQTGRDLGFAASVFTGVDQTTPVGNTAVSGQYINTTGINADLVFAANSMGVYNSYQNRSNTGPFTARTGNTQLGSYVTATGNSGFESAMGYRGPETSAATYNVGSDATVNSVGGGCASVELLIASGTTSTLTGTITASVTEADIVTGGKTLIITLVGDTWKVAGTGPIGSTADTQALIDGFSATSSPTNGWNNEVRDNAATTEIVRTSATVATWTVAAQSGYDITAQEVITGTIPTAALTTGAGAIVSTPTFTIDPVSSGIVVFRRRIEARRR